MKTRRASNKAQLGALAQCARASLAPTAYRRVAQGGEARHARTLFKSGTPPNHQVASASRSAELRRAASLISQANPSSRVSSYSRSRRQPHSNFTKIALSLAQALPC